MPVLSPIPEQYPDPDCHNCGGDGVAQSFRHLVLGDDFSNTACPLCWSDEQEGQTE